MLGNVPGRIRPDDARLVPHQRADHTAERDDTDDFQRFPGDPGTAHPETATTGCVHRVGAAGREYTDVRQDGGEPEPLVEPAGPVVVPLDVEHHRVQATPGQVVKPSGGQRGAETADPGGRVDPEDVHLTDRPRRAGWTRVGIFGVDFRPVEPHDAIRTALVGRFAGRLIGDREKEPGRIEPVLRHLGLQPGQIEPALFGMPGECPGIDAEKRLLVLTRDERPQPDSGGHAAVERRPWSDVRRICNSTRPRARSSRRATAAAAGRSPYAHTAPCRSSAADTSAEPWPCRRATGSTTTSPGSAPVGHRNTDNGAVRLTAAGPRRRRRRRAHPAHAPRSPRHHR